MDRASATETADSDSIPGPVQPKTVKLAFTASLLDVQQLKRQFDASTLCAVAYAGFSKDGGGGGRKFRKFENNEDQNENFPAQNQVRFPTQT